MMPEIYLAIDNCFASKRWCEVGEWMRIVADLGIRYVEASADNEIDPLYSSPEHLDDWIAEVEEWTAKTGVRVVNCYSGHGTYSTLGLAHYDRRVREHIKNNWMKKMMATAGRLGAGLGFFAHAFPEKVLRDREAYRLAYEDLVTNLRELSITAEANGLKTFGIEQMYTPHQVPWTVRGTDDFLRQTNDKDSGSPVYITLDTGHQSGQRHFLPPADRTIEAFFRATRTGESTDIYLGPIEFHDALRDEVLGGASFEQIKGRVAEYIDAHPYLFAEYGDGDTYRWLEHFACYSPIIHLQQTDGTVSAHKCFTSELNEWGIIHAEEALSAIQRNARRETPAGYPPKVSRIYLTLEPFLSTASHPRVMLKQIAESVAYWRRFIPEDGVPIDALCERLSQKEPCHAK